ncbi:MAG: Fur family transcriptional regulator, partial [Spirochaetota bacterium]
EILKKAGLKITKTRVAVLKMLCDAGKPISHTDIMDGLPNNSSWDRVTIYRTLAEFEQKRIVKSLNSGNRIKYYEFLRNDTVNQHAHLFCNECGKIECLDLSDSLAIGLDKDFVILDVEILIRGVCKFCQ